MTLSPFFRSPFTDITGGLISHQMLGRCQKEEMRYMDCLEAYGLERGKRKCMCLFDDYHECHTFTKQFKRFIVSNFPTVLHVQNKEIINCFYVIRWFS